MGLDGQHSMWTGFRFGVLYAASSAIVLFCRLWVSYWALICLALAFLGLAALGVFAHLGMAMHWLIIAGFAVVALWIARKHTTPFIWPTRAHVEHEMERAANIAHRPLAALRDSIHNAEAAALWAIHRQRASAARANVKLARPDIDISARDPYDLRHISGLFFAIALLIAAHHAPARLAHALTPALPPLPVAAKPAVDIWVAPPAYTQAAPVYLARAQNAQATLDSKPEVPAGSVLKIRISGQRLPPVIRLDGKRVAVTRIDNRNYSAETKLAHNSALTIRQGLRHLGRWDVSVIADQAPKITLVDAGKGVNGLLKITWQAGDDYGLTALSARIDAPKEHHTLLDGQTQTTIDLPLPIRPEAGKKLDGVFSESIDLSRHLLAGTPVQLTLSATDDAGQTSTSDTLDVTLPERTFTSAVAQRVADARKRLIWFAKNWLARDFTSFTLLDIVNNPDSYRNDRTVFLTMVSAIKRLGYDGRDEAVTSTRDLLWDIALRIEDGGVSEAARDLQQAMTAFNAALNNPEATQQQLEELLGQVQQKMQEYMQALANEMQQRQQMQPGQGQMPPEIADKVMQKIDLEAVMQQLREMANGDQRQQMRQMMDMLRNAVQNMDLNAMARMQQQQQQAMQALQDLANVVRAQQELIEKTAQAGQGTSPQDWQDMAGEQEAINQGLQKLQGKLGPLAGGMQQNLNAAGEKMGQSGDHLGQGQRDGALDAQKQALQELIKAQDNAMQQLADQMQKMMMMGMGGRPQGGYGEGFDPLGREFGNGKTVGGSIGIPNEGERRRVQDIQRELRDRYNDGNRPRSERDYLERLLDLFR